MSTETTSVYATLIVAVTTLILAIAYLIRRLNTCQLATCCKLSVQPSETQQEPESTSLAMVAGIGDEIVRRISRDNNLPPPPEESTSQIV